MIPRLVAVVVYISSNLLALTLSYVRTWSPFSQTIEVVNPELEGGNVIQDYPVKVAKVHLILLVSHRLSTVTCLCSSNVSVCLCVSVLRWRCKATHPHFVLFFLA